MGEFCQLRMSDDISVPVLSDHKSQSMFSPFCQLFKKLADILKLILVNSKSQPTFGSIKSFDQ